MPLAYLFLDLNAYFASVEQQLNPAWRGKPVVVSPLDNPSGCCIAASYEAKRIGIKTGMRVGEARALCPALIVAPSRPRKYVEFHHQILEAVETCAPVRAVHSIDEMSIRLAHGERTAEEAAALGRKIKSAIAERVGPCMRCSIGIAPNTFLAKVASDMQKPDGLVILDDQDLPGKLLPLQLQDLPGIGPRMDARLRLHGVTTVEKLVGLSEKELGALWGSVVGRKWWYLLRGYDLYERPTHRRSIGHQHVLPPDRRTDERAWEVAARLMHKAAARARHLGFWVQKMSLSIGYRGEKGYGWGRGGGWSGVAGFPGGTQDTIAMLEELRRLWSERAPGTPMLVSVTMFDLLNAASATQPLFPEERRRSAISTAMDLVNAKQGANTVYLGSMHDARASAPGGIAFSHIPDLDFVDSVRERQAESEYAALQPRRGRRVSGSRRGRTLRPRGDRAG